MSTTREDETASAVRGYLATLMSPGSDSAAPSRHDSVAQRGTNDMTTDERYNGWTNRETWAVALHINNDQGWQESVHEALRAADPSSCPDCSHREDSTDHEGFRDCTSCGAAWTPAYTAGDVIRENVESTLEQVLEAVHDGATEQDTYSIIREDIGSLWRVDWTELGAAFLADLEEN